MMWKVIGALVLVTAALTVAMWAFYRLGRTDGRAQLLAEMAERRSLRRAQARAAAYVPRHQAAPWPGPEPAEQLATTGELRIMAETGDIGELKRHNAAFERLHAFAQWVRAA